jgi:hypothetical protein
MTLRNLEIKSSASISIHKVHLGGGLAEFTGSEPQQISFKLRVSAFFGVNPETQIKLLEGYLRNGTQLTFVLGNKTYGRYRWLLESLSQDVEYYDKRGNVTQCDLSISLREYLKG